MTQRAHVFVTGRVQGVSFRAWTRRTASERGLHGWVRNLADGRVEAVFEGPRGAVEQQIAWCQEGSPHARVEHVEVRWEEPEEEDGFRVRYG